MRYLGEEGYTRIAAQILAISDRLQASLQAIDGAEVVGKPDLPILAWHVPGQKIDRVVAGMSQRGWFVRPMARPAAVHMGMITLHQGPAVGPYLADVADVVASLK